MKTLKIAVIALLVAFTMVNLSYAGGLNEKPKFRVVATLKFEQAVKDPLLVRAMYLQLDRDEFYNAHQHFYVAEVLYKGKNTRISGTFDQWVRFFSRDVETRNKSKRSGESAE